MRLSGAFLIAWSGVYAYVGLFYGVLYLLRREPEYRLFSGLCGFLVLLSLAGAFIGNAASPAEAVHAQQAQILGLVPALSFFCALVLELTGEPRPRLVRALYAWTTAAVMACAAGLFVDPQDSHCAYDWGAAGPGNRALAKVTWVGVVFIAGAAAASIYVTWRMFVCSRHRADLRLPFALTALGLVGGASNVAARIFDFSSLGLAGHSAMLPVLGFTYVLVGRFIRVDAQLADRTKELARSYHDLRKAQEQLVKQEQLAAVGELSAVIAHEVRNPLAIVKNAVGGLRREELAPDDAQTLIGILDEETDRLNRLVQDLLAYAKPIAPEPGRVTLPALVMHAVELAGGGSHAAHVELELDLEREVDPVQGDEALLRHALINIVDNALQAMPNGGTLTVSCRNVTVDGRPSVSVDFHDTGEGMDTLVRTRARDPFFTTRQSGTGLGLAIVDRVARVHGGRVELESRHGRGTTVSLVVPCHHEPDASD